MAEPTTAATALPSDLVVLDAARNALSNVRDWLKSDTTDAIAGHRSLETSRNIAHAMQQIELAKGSIDAAKDAAYRQRGR
jgi:hypothetical protein